MYLKLFTAFSQYLGRFLHQNFKMQIVDVFFLCKNQNVNIIKNERCLTENQYR